MTYKSPDKIVYDSATGTTFKEAFADARKEGQKTFEWNGKKYGTKLKGEDEPKQGKVKEDATIEAGRRQKSVSKEDKKEDKKEGSRGTAATLAGAGLGLGAMAILSGLRGAERARVERELNKGREYKAPPRIKDLGPGESAWENEGGRYYKKGGKVKKMAGGGTTPTVPKPAPKKDNTPIPAWLQNERKNQEQDRLNRREREEYDKGEKTRLRDQGGFKKGGVTRGDGIAMRGKTKGRMR